MSLGRSALLKKHQSSTQNTAKQSNVTRLKNQDSLFDNRLLPKESIDPSAFFNNIVDSLSHRSLTSEEREELCNQAFSLKCQITELLLTVPAIQKYILERQTIDFARKNKRSFLIRGYEANEFTDGQSQNNDDADFGINPSLLQPLNVQLGELFYDYIQAHHEFGGKNIKTITLKMGLDSNFRSLNLTHIAFQRLNKVFIETFEDEIPIHSIDSFLDYSDFLKLKDQYHALKEKHIKIVNKIAQHQMLYVVQQIRKKTSDPTHLIELINRAYIGLIEGIERFNPNLGTQLITPITYRVSKSIIDYYQDYYNQSERDKAFVAFTSKDHYSEGTTPIFLKPEWSLHSEDITDSDNITSTAFNDGTTDTLEEVERQQEAEILHGMLKELLNEQQLLVISIKHGIGCQEGTIKEISSQIGLCAERVRQIDKAAMNILKSTPAFAKAFGYA